MCPARHAQQALRAPLACLPQLPALRARRLASRLPPQTPSQATAQPAAVCTALHQRKARRLRPAAAAVLPPPLRRHSSAVMTQPVRRLLQAARRQPLLPAARQAAATAAPPLPARPGCTQAPLAGLPGSRVRHAHDQGSRHSCRPVSCQMRAAMAGRRSRHCRPAARARRQLEPALTLAT